MIDINNWTKTFSERLYKLFGERIWFVGIQGSYARGEASETSDIDMVVILDELGASDIQEYNSMLDTLPHRELICGFVCGKIELMSWEPSDLFQFYYDTKSIKGSLDVILPLIDDDAIARAVKIGACNLYHGCVHNMIHEKSSDILKSLYKSASFLIQAITFKETGKYVSSKADLLPLLSQNDRKILENLEALKQGGMTDCKKMSETLFEWSKNLISKQDT